MTGEQLEHAYLQELEARAIMPKGFSAGVTSLSFVPQERPTQAAYKMNLSTLFCTKPTGSIAGVFTQNAFPGAPVIIAREKLTRKRAQGFLVNNKIANVSSARGVHDATKITQTFADHLSLDPQDIFPVSTGIIGWGLPVSDIEAALPALAKNVQSSSLLPFAKGIMTTDSFPKLRRSSLGSGSLVGVAKGAGMIEPNLATMLVFLVTDVSFPPDLGQRVLARVVDRTFNCISVDSDQSTSDMVMLLGSDHYGPVNEQQLEVALTEVCQELAEDIVRNGEGTSHILAVEVDGRSNDKEARSIGKAVVNSPLVKTAMYGNDPNVGRILSSMGNYLGNAGLGADMTRLEISLGEEVVFHQGTFKLDKEKESRISDYLASRAMNPTVKGYPQPHDRVEIKVHFHQGPGRARVLGSDLSYEYVRENADYRS
ncbi:MAG: bifunctional glutamate N-acetyltransferase/amino-acid acetyltransferase ArgJ [Spirochaetales bacterium]|nr:bifunctional glutamate N-acetyltransferase/amino-acid acetyltransferase ArgJ [Spirochaetales bacterium]